MEYTEEAREFLRNIIKERDKYPIFLSKEYVLYVNSFLNETGYAGIAQLESVIEQSNIFAKLYVLSAKIYFTHEIQDIVTILELVTNAKELSFYNRYYLYYQIQNYIFTNPALDTNETFVLKEKLLKKILSEMVDNMELPELKPHKADSNLVIVIASQILSYDHAPTKTALDRCAALKKTGRNVMLINTAETYSKQGHIPFYAEKEGTYNESLSSRSSLNWLGENIPYFQCDNNMPDLAQMEMLTSFILDRNPSLVISIGGTDLLAGVCAKYFPVLTVSLYPSSLEPALSQYQTLGRKLQDEDRQLLNRIGRDSDYVIEGQFTYSFKPQSMHFKRCDFGLDDNDFVVAVIGSRLEAEVDQNFIRMLNKVKIDAFKVLFIGGFANFEQFMRKTTFDTSKFKYAGYSDDVLAMLELCDVYLNPLRKGGGSSALEALYKGIPVITPGYGDVAVNAGECFCMDMDRIPALIEKYSLDKNFYKTMSAKGKLRVESLLNNSYIFEGIVNEVFCREGKNDIKS